MADDAMLQALWQQANKPLLPQIGQAGQAAEQAVTEPRLDESRSMAMMKGFGGGAMRGIADLMQAQTSPLALLALLAGGGLGLAGRRAGSTVGTALRTAPHTAPEAATLGAEFSPVGEEAVYNAARTTPKPPLNSSDAFKADAFKRYVKKYNSSDTTKVR